jgi:hypothetical protein
VKNSAPALHVFNNLTLKDIGVDIGVLTDASTDVLENKKSKAWSKTQTDRVKIFWQCEVVMAVAEVLGVSFFDAEHLFL